MAEWTKATVLKTVVPQVTVGSNPTLSAIDFELRCASEDPSKPAGWEGSQTPRELCADSRVRRGSFLHMPCQAMWPGRSGYAAVTTRNLLPTDANRKALETGRYKA